MLTCGSVSINNRYYDGIKNNEELEAAIKAQMIPMIESFLSDDNKVIDFSRKLVGFQLKTNEIKKSIDINHYTEENYQNTKSLAEEMLDYFKLDSRVRDYINEQLWQAREYQSADILKEILN